MNETEDLYEILQVHPSADPDVIQAAYRRLALRYHPDRNKWPPAAEVMKRLNHAYSILSDPVLRAAYDRTRAASATSRPAPPERTEPDPRRNRWFCTSCGRELASGEKFCPGCGLAAGGGQDKSSPPEAPQPSGTVHQDGVAMRNTMAKVVVSVAAVIATFVALWTIWLVILVLVGFVLLLVAAWLPGLLDAAIMSDWGR